MKFVCLMMSMCIFSFGIFFLSWHTPHFLSMLLILELLNMGVLLLLSCAVSCTVNSYGFYIFMFMMVFTVGEAVVGLSLMVSSSRGGGMFLSKSYLFMGI